MSFLRSCLAAFLLLPILPSALAADPPPVETFYRRPQFERMALSPDGKLLAAIVPARGRSNLAVIDLQTVKAQPITGFDNSDVIEFHWLGNKRLLLRSGDLREAQGSARYYGWFAIDADGKYVRRLTVPAVVQERTVRRENMMLEFGYLGRVPDADDEIFVAKYVSDSYTRQVYRLNTRDGATRLASLDSPPDPIGWVMDHAGVARVAISYRRGRVTVRYRDDPKAPWKTLAEGDQTSLDFNPLGFDYDNKTLFVSMRDGKDTAGIHIYDTDKNASKEVFVQHPLVDIDHLVFSRGKKKLLGVTYEADKPGVVWLDGEMQRLQKTVDKALPDTVNILGVADENPRRAIVWAYSDTDPGRFYLLDTEKLSLEELAASRPWIDPKAMSERKFVRYPARDGLLIPAWLTIPKGSSGKNLPLVVNIHGGPFVRGHGYGFDADAQFLASRGYAVLQPEFRGSRGYGQRLFSAGLKQWGLAMQDDISDGVAWLAREGIADKGRVCLMGGSYGGYATLWGLIKEPDVYRCGVASVAVTDISLLFDIVWSDTARSPFEWLEYGARQMIGDPDKDREKFKSVSPLYQAERLKAPVLLAFGASDQRVPIKHGNEFRSALDKHGKTYELVVYSDEGHGFNKDENSFDFYRRVDAFLKKHLAAP